MLSSKKHIDKSRLGRLLVNRGYISEEQLLSALTVQREMGVKLGEVLVQRGHISERDLSRTLKHQDRYRFAAAFVAMVVTPLQPAVAFASGAAGATIPKTPVSASQQIAQSKFGSMRSLADSELGGVSAQGLVDDFQKLGDRISAVKSGDYNDADYQEDITQVEILAHMFLPITNFLESDTKIEGVVYDSTKSIMKINEDGSVTMGFPTHIDRISMENINVAGASTPSFGNVYMSDINFHPDMNITIRVR
jgi:hypothetical protein